MKQRDIGSIWFRISGLVLWFVFLPFCYSQTTSATLDTTAAPPDSVRMITTVINEAEEIILETIPITAMIEKPNVALIHRKAETDVGEVPFNLRSFDQELKEKPEVISEYGKELENPKRVKKIKKSLEKKSK